MTNSTHGARYKVKGIDGVETYIRVLADHGDGYDILITSITDGRVKESSEFIGRELLEACMRTGYICTAPAETVAIA
ncbi:MAG: hypothetical protein LC641_10460 [Spirochaeta sp.]|nr:hypothetical protein [Spirochaeta sp.]